MLYRILALLLLVPINAQAIECEAESPLKVLMGDKYYDLISEATQRTAPEKRLIEQAVKTLGDTKFRSGHATRIVCKKVEGELTAVANEFKLKDANSHYTSHGDINLSMLLDDSENRVVSRHLVTFPDSDNWQIGNANNQVLINHRFRRFARGMNTTTHSLVEHDIALTLLEKGIGVTQNIYTNGYLVEQTNWTLLKR